MKVVILAGGLGTRLSEETVLKPKPMVEIGGRPILWHIMKHYAHYGFKEFFIALGYKGDIVKRFFLDYYTMNGSLSVDLASGNVRVHDHECEDWIVHLMDTGDDTLTGGRIRRLGAWLKNEPFMVTYGDGVCDINYHDLIKFHSAQKRMATVTAVRPPARFGELLLDGPLISEFTEKPQTGEGWINGGFMVFEPEVLNYFGDDKAMVERDALEKLAAQGQLAAYRHEGFWQCMDTLRDVRLLETLWQSGKAPWKVGQEEWATAMVSGNTAPPLLRVAQG